MKRSLKRWSGLVLGAMALFAIVLAPSANTYAATTQDVQINATPAYVSISNDIGTWDLNGITGGGYILINTIYYANPLGDTASPSATVNSTEGRFTLTDGGNVNITLAVVCGNFTGGDATMTNGDDGSNGATTYGGYSWYEGMTYASKVIMKVSGSDNLKADHSGTLGWGAEIETQTDAWGGSGQSVATMTISATAS